MSDFLSNLLQWVTTTGIKVVIALVVLIIAFKVIKAVVKKLEKSLLKTGKLDETLIKSLCYAARIALDVLVVLALVGYLGIDTSGFAAFVASLGVCVGLAVNGTLSNLAGGVMLLITRPFSVGDYIQAQGVEGVVEDIRVANTRILTLDNKSIYLPNGSLSAGTIVNFSEEKLRRIDIDYSVAGNDPDQVKKLILDVCAANPRIQKDPAPFAMVSDYGTGNGVKVTMRAWVPSAEYWDGYFELVEANRVAFEKAGIVIPFNQLDVHIKNN